MLHTYENGKRSVICDKCYNDGKGTVPADGVYQTGRYGRSELCEWCADLIGAERVGDIDKRQEKEAFSDRESSFYQFHVQTPNDCVRYRNPKDAEKAYNSVPDARYFIDGICKASKGTLDMTK